jgi:hypothetical protein
MFFLYKGWAFPKFEMPLLLFFPVIPSGCSPGVMGKKKKKLIRPMSLVLVKPKISLLGKSPKKCVCLDKHGEPMKDNGQNGCKRRWIQRIQIHLRLWMKM